MHGRKDIRINHLAISDGCVDDAVVSRVHAVRHLALQVGGDVWQNGALAHLRFLRAPDTRLDSPLKPKNMYYVCCYHTIVCAVYVAVVKCSQK